MIKFAERCAFAPRGASRGNRNWRVLKFDVFIRDQLNSCGAALPYEARPARVWRCLNGIFSSLFEAAASLHSTRFIQLSLYFLFAECVFRAQTHIFCKINRLHEGGCVDRFRIGAW